MIHNDLMAFMMRHDNGVQSMTNNATTGNTGEETDSKLSVPAHTHHQLLFYAMEDRHTISEPRRLVNDGDTNPCWEVDILRDDSLVVDTFVLNSTVLPPRVNKKGKVLWKLPETGVPSFGSEDRRRILDIYKKRKKERKKLSLSSSIDGCDDVLSEGVEKAVNITADDECDSGRDLASNDVRRVQREKVCPGNNVGDRVRSSFNEPQHNNTISLPSVLRPPPGMSAPPLIAEDRPALQSQTSDSLYITVPLYERPERTHGQPDASLAVPAARYFITKYYSYFDSTSGLSLSDLARYYTLKAQKSVSIGEAHSVVTGRDDITAQICSLAGTTFVVRGVVAQDTADGNGVHMLVTGTAATSLNGSSGGVVANFAHSISLVPVNDEENREGKISCPALIEALQMGFPFQIHNDALAYLPVTPTTTK